LKTKAIRRITIMAASRRTAAKERTLEKEYQELATENEELQEEITSLRAKLSRIAVIADVGDDDLEDGD
jgi:cell division protein FtsB